MLKVDNRIPDIKLVLEKKVTRPSLSITISKIPSFSTYIYDPRATLRCRKFVEHFPVL